MAKKSKYIEILSKYWEYDEKKTKEALIHSIIQDWTSEYDPNQLKKAFEIDEDLLLEKEAINEIKLEEIETVSKEYEQEVDKKLDELFKKL